MGNESTKKSNPIIKIIIAIIIVAVLAVIGYGAYKYSNCDKNENGVSYSAGKTKDRVYTNDWAEVKIDLDTGLQDYTSMVYIPSIQNILDNLNNVLKDRNGSAEAIFLGAKLFEIGSDSAYIPGVIMYVITDESFTAKIFGTKLDTFLDDADPRTMGLPASGSITRIDDMVLCGKSYRTYLFAGLGGGSNPYMCTRAIGNKVVLFYFCNIPDYFKLDTIKGYFIN